MAFLSGTLQKVTIDVSGELSLDAENDMHMAMTRQ